MRADAGLQLLFLVQAVLLAFGLRELRARRVMPAPFVRIAMVALAFYLVVDQWAEVASDRTYTDVGWVLIVSIYAEVVHAIPTPLPPVPIARARSRSRLASKRMARWPTGRCHAGTRVAARGFECTPALPARELLP